MKSRVSYLPIEIFELTFGDIIFKHVFNEFYVCVNCCPIQFIGLFNNFPMRLKLANHRVLIDSNFSMLAENHQADEHTSSQTRLSDSDTIGFQFTITTAAGKSATICKHQISSHGEAEVRIWVSKTTHILHSSL